MYINTRDIYFPLRIFTQIQRDKFDISCETRVEFVKVKPLARYNKCTYINRYKSFQIILCVKKAD